jgi:hypothetical protein
MSLHSQVVSAHQTLYLYCCVSNRLFGALLLTALCTKHFTLSVKQAIGAYSVAHKTLHIMSIKQVDWCITVP